MYRVNLNMCFTVSFLEWGSGGGIHTQCIVSFSIEKSDCVSCIFLFSLDEFQTNCIWWRTEHLHIIVCLNWGCLSTCLYVWLLSLMIYEWLSKPQLCGARWKTWSFLVSSARTRIAHLKIDECFPAILLQSSITQTDFFFWLIKKKTHPLPNSS